MSRGRSPPPYPEQASGNFLDVAKSNRELTINDASMNKRLEMIEAVGGIDDNLSDPTNNQIGLQCMDNAGHSVLPACLENRILTHPDFDFTYRLIHDPYSQSQNAMQHFQSVAISKNNLNLSSTCSLHPKSLSNDPSCLQQHQQLKYYQQQLTYQPEIQFRHLQQCRHQQPTSHEPFGDGSRTNQRHTTQHHQHQPQRQMKYPSNHNSFEGRPWSSAGVCLRPVQRNFSLPNSPLLSHRHQLRQPNYQQDHLYRRLLQQQQQSQLDQQRQLSSYDPLYYDYCLHARSNDRQSVPVASDHDVQNQNQCSSHQVRGMASQQSRQLQHFHSPLDSYRTFSLADQSQTSEQPMQRPQSAFPQLDVMKQSQPQKHPNEEVNDFDNSDDQLDSYDHRLYLYLRRKCQDKNNENAAENSCIDLKTDDNRTSASRTKEEFKTDFMPEQCHQRQESSSENTNSGNPNEDGVLKQLPLFSLKISPDSMIGQLLASSKQLTLQHKPPLAQSQQPQSSQTKPQSTKQPQQSKLNQQPLQQNKQIPQQAVQKITPQSGKPVTPTTPRPSFLATTQATQSFMQSGKKGYERRGSKGSPTSATAPCTPTSNLQSSFLKRSSPPKNPMMGSSSNGSPTDSPVSVSVALKSNPQKLSFNNNKILSARKGSAPPGVPSNIIRGVAGLATHRTVASKIPSNSAKASTAGSQAPMASKKSSSPPLTKSQAVRKSSAPNPYGSVNGSNHVSTSRARHSSASSNGNSGSHSSSLTTKPVPASRPTNLSANGANVIRLNGNLIPRSSIVESQTIHSSTSTRTFINPVDSLDAGNTANPNDQLFSYPSKLDILPEAAIDICDESGKNESLADPYFDGRLDEDHKESLISGPLNQLHQSQFQHSPLSGHHQFVSLKQQSDTKRQQLLIKQMSQQLLQQSKSDFLRMSHQQPQQQSLMLQHQQSAQNYPPTLQQCSNLVDARNGEALQTPDDITSPIMTSTPKPRNCESSSDLGVSADQSASVHIVKQLSDENKILRKELENYYKKISTLEKVEKEIERMGRAYESLVNQTERRENLERIVRLKLESEVIRLNEDNRDFKDQLQQCLVQLETLNDSLAPSSTPLTSPCQYHASSSVELQQKKELQRKDAMLMKLLKQNHTLLSAKNELEFEASVLRKTLEEQKKQMATLKQSLAQAQAASNKYFIELENFRSREASVIHTQPQHPGSSNSNENGNSGSRGNNYFDSYFVDGIHYDNCILRSHKMLFSEEKNLLNDEYDTDDGISSDSSVDSNIKRMKAVEIRKLLENWERRYCTEQSNEQKEKIESAFDTTQEDMESPQSLGPRKKSKFLLGPGLSSKVLRPDCFMVADNRDCFYCLYNGCKRGFCKGEMPDPGTTLRPASNLDACLFANVSVENGNFHTGIPASPSDRTMIVNDNDENKNGMSADDDDDLQF